MIPNQDYRVSLNLSRRGFDISEIQKEFFKRELKEKHHDV